jgi:tetratricopeptide (TPR) repeat protein
MDGNTPERRFETWIALVFCLVLAGLAYGPGLSGDFLNYDDPRTVLENPAFAGGSVDLGLILDPTQRLADVYLPVNYLSLGLDVLLFGTGSALPFHLHALLLQALAGFVLVLLLRDLGASRSLALLGACPLLAHPALAESVLWVSSRKETLVALFGLLALWTGRRAIAGRAALWLPALMALLACYSKGSGIALPLMALPLWLLLPAAGARRSRFGIVFGTVTLVCVGAAVHHYWLASSAGTMGFSAAFAAAPASYVHAWSTTLWPSGLAIHHPRAEFLELASERILFNLLIALASVVLVVVLLRRRGQAPRMAATGLLVFAGAWAPFNAWIPATALPVADRYLQMPVIGAGLVLVALAIFVSRAKEAPRRAPLLHAAFLLVVAVALGGLSMARSGDFVDSGQIWRANLEQHSDDAVAWINLAEWQRRQRDVPLQELERTTARAELLADEPFERFRVRELQFDLANLSGDGRRIIESREKLVEAADALPEPRPGVREQRIFARFLLAEALVEEGRFAEAELVLQEILRRKPDHIDALALLASCTMRDVALGTPKERVAVAQPLLDQAEELPGRETSYHLRLAQAERLFLLDDLRARGAIVALQDSGLRPALSTASRIYALSADVFLARALIEEAVEVLQAGIRVWPKAALLHAKLGQMLYASRRFAQAEQHLRDALELRPGNDKLERLLGSCLLLEARNLARTEEPSVWRPKVDEAAQLVPQHPSLPLLQARALFAERRLNAALVQARMAHQRAPEDEETLRTLLDILSANGYARLMQNERDDAMRFFREMLERAPEGYPLEAVREVLRTRFVERARLGAEAARKEDWEGAAVHLRGAFALFPSDTQPFPEYVNATGQLGVVLSRLGAWQDSEQLFSKLVGMLEKLDRDVGQAVLYRVIALLELERKEEAQRFAELYLTGAKAERIRDPQLRERIRAELQRG